MNLKFVTVLEKIRYWTLSAVTLKELMFLQHNCVRSILILLAHLRLVLPSSFFPLNFRTKTLYTFLATLTLLEQNNQMISVKSNEFGHV
jgi:hypothetical protein